MPTKIISPRYFKNAQKKPFVVIFFRIVAVIQFVICFLLAGGVAQPLVEQLLQRYGVAYDTVETLSTPIAFAIAAFFGFLACSLTWALSMVVDDLHAMRTYLEGMNVYEEKEKEKPSE